MEKTKIEIIESLRNEVEFQIKKLNSNDEFINAKKTKTFQNKPDFDILMTLGKTSKNTEILNIKNTFKELMFKAEKHFFSEDYLMSLTEIYGIYGDIDSNFIKQVFTKDKITVDETLEVSDLLDQVQQIIPSYFKKEKVDIVLMGKGRSFYDMKKKELHLNIKQSKTNLISEIFHEFGHIIEIQNPHIFEESLKFIKSKTGNEISRPNVILGPFCHPYIGTIYEWNSTEVVSMGLQLMFLNPIMFLFRDPEHFEFIEYILKKE